MRFAPGAPDTASSTTTAQGAADGTTIIDTDIYSSAIDQLVRQRSVICITSHPAVVVSTSSIADPSVITTASAHGFATGDSVTIAGHVSAIPDINGTHTVTFISATTFSIPVNVTTDGTGGTVTAAAGRRGERRYATGPPTSGGVITVSPPFNAQTIAGMTYEVWDPDGPHPDIVDRMIDRALREDCWRWVPMPITYVPYGDFGEELAVSTINLVDGAVTAWTGANITLTLESQTPPQEFVRRVVRITDDGSGAGYLESQTIDVDPANRGAWHIEALVRAQGAGAAVGDARIVLYDKTNSGAIVPTTALTWVARGWGLIKSDFTIPATCYQIAIRLVTQNVSEVADWAWVQGWPVDQTRFSMPQRIVALKHVGATFVRVGDIFDNFKRAPFDGSLDKRDVGGTGVQLEIEPAIGTHALWFYERDAFPTLTTATPAATDDDATTWAADLWLRAAVTWELYRWLSQRDRKTEQGAPEGAEQPIQRGWRQAEQQALEDLLAMQQEYGAAPMAVEDAASPAHAATRQVN
jgi:hypothetical protein